ncbi:gliding motility-associated C-terminal domain-containing protein, partial [Flavobacteriales bacterium AH-315-E23]|nr:gliding motility-associated C-terminal domain-containing protein [Flavobacteriales bacterium AH-315-E23]
NNTSLTATYTPGPGDVSTSSVTLMITTDNPAGSCAGVSDILVLTINQEATVDAGSDAAICANSTYTLSGTMGGSATNITWTTSGDGTFDNVVLLAATYTPGASDITFGVVTFAITTDDPSGPCPAVVDIMTLFINPLPVLTTSSSSSTCGLADGDATVTPITGTGPFTYQWDANAGSQTDSTATALSAGTYNVSVTDANGCTDSTTVSVTDLGAPVIDSVQSTNVICNGEGNGSITIFASGGVSPLSYSINSGISFQSGNDFTGLPGANYVVVVEDATGCQVFGTTLTINEPAALTSTITGTDVTCNGDNDGSVSVATSGGTGNYTYLWAPAGETSSSINNISGGSYTVTVTDANGCNTSEAISITEPQAVVVNITGTNSICSGSSTTLTASTGLSGASYQWNTGDTDSSITVTPASDTTYMVNANVGGCLDSASVAVTVIPIAPVTISGTTGICAGETTTLTATAAASYVWSPGGETTQSITVSPANMTTYMVTATDACGTSTDSITVTVNPLPVANAGEDALILSGESAQLGGTFVVGNTYTWSPATTLNDPAIADPLASPTENTTYYLTVTDASGCENTDTVMVDVENTNIIYVPDIFSPNSDDKNDAVYVMGSGIDQLIFVIYDRWGEKVFETNCYGSKECGWDGVFRGKRMNPAVFAYYLEGSFKNGEEFKIIGDITLIY